MALGLGAAGFGAGFGKGLANIFIGHRQQQVEEARQAEDRKLRAFSAGLPLYLQLSQQSGDWSFLQDFISAYAPDMAKALQKEGGFAQIAPLFQQLDSVMGEGATGAPPLSKRMVQAGAQPIQAPTEAGALPSRPLGMGEREAAPPERTFFGRVMPTPEEEAERQQAITIRNIQTLLPRIRDQILPQLQAEDPDATIFDALRLFGFQLPGSQQQAPPQVGTFGDFLLRRQAELGRQLTPEDVGAARQEWTRAGREETPVNWDLITGVLSGESRPRTFFVNRRTREIVDQAGRPVTGEIRQPEAAPAQQGTETERFLARAAGRTGRSLRDLSQDEELELLRQYQDARRQQPDVMPELEIRQVPEDETLWNRLGWFTTGPLSALPRSVGRLTGFGQASIENIQAFETARNTLLRALAENPRFPVAERTAIAREVNVQPNLWDSTTTVRTRMHVINRFLTDMRARRLAEGDRSGANAIAQFQAWMGVPTTGTAGTLRPAHGTVQVGDLRIYNGRTYRVVGVDETTGRAQLEPVD
jgi:hypothetical protein